MSDLLSVHDVTVDCVLGVYPEERRRPQPVVVSFSLRLDTRRAAHESDLALSVDYARVVGQVRHVLQRGAFLLLETAAEVVAAVVLSGVEAVDELTLTLKKPRALDGNGVPALTIVRRREGGAGLWTFPFGVVEVVWQGHGLGFYRLALRSHAGVKLPTHVEVYDIDGGRQGETLTNDGRIVNQTARERALLLVSRPPLRLDAFASVS